MRTVWFVGLSAIVALTAGCDAGRERSQGASSQRQADPEGAGPAMGSRPMTPPACADAGPKEKCSPTDEIGATFDGLFDEADANRDGRISKIEASSFATSLTEREFTRADANHDGQVTPAEARQARMEFKREHPRLSLLLDQVRAATGQTPFSAMAQMAAIESNQPLKREDVLRITQAAVDEAFRAADKNRDGMISREEARTAATDLARQASDMAFTGADKNRDGKLSFAEFQQAITPAARTAFDLADKNKDGNLSEEEAKAAVTHLTDALGL